MATAKDEESWRGIIRGPAMNELLRLQLNDEHRMLTNAGWSYRTSDPGWIIYQHTHTGRWYTLKDALHIMRSETRLAFRLQ
jgi:hypothetical protein